MKYSPTPRKEIDRKGEKKRIFERNDLPSIFFLPTQNPSNHLFLGNIDREENKVYFNRSNRSDPKADRAQEDSSCSPGEETSREEKIG